MIATILIVAFLAGCATAPVVVQEIPAVQTQQPVVKPAPRNLLVLPLTGLAPRIGIAVGIRTAWTLRQAGYPARHVTVSDGINPVLSGTITQTSGDGDIIWLDIDWAAYHADGSLIGKYLQKTAVPQGSWRLLSTETLGVVVIEAMPGIDTLIRTKMFPPGSQMASANQPVQAVDNLVYRPDDTVIVSGQGMARVNNVGRKVWEPLVSVSTESGIVTLVKPADRQVALDPVVLIDPSARRNQFGVYVADNLTEEYAREIDTNLPSVDDITDLPHPTSQTMISSDPTPRTPRQIADEKALEEVEVLAALVTLQADVPAEQPEDAVSEVGKQILAAFAALQKPPVFLVRQVIGAPGDGGVTLRNAMRKALRNNDAMISDDMDQVSHIVQGTVRVEVPFTGKQRVRIVWMITDTSGLEMGTALQENDVPEGSLNEAWGPVAQSIADAAVLGIAQLFETGLDAGGAGGRLAQPDLPHLQ